MQFLILDGLKTVPADQQSWDAWHRALNSQKDEATRTIDKHTLVKLGSRIQVVTMFTGWPGEPWMTFVSGYPGMCENSACMGHAMHKHHEIVGTLLDQDWKMNPAFNPASIAGERDA